MAVTTLNPAAVTTARDASSEAFGPRAAVESILNTYAIVYFSRNPWFGAVLLAVTFLSPTFGIFGLAGTTTALAAARLLGFRLSGIRNGELLYNSMLVSLGLAYLTHFQPLGPVLLLVLLPAVSLLTLLLSVALSHGFRQLLGLPVLSLPFVSVTFLLYFLFYSFTGTPVVGSEPLFLVPEPTFLPAIIASFFQSLGAAFFLPHVLAGMVTFAVLLWHSRLLTLLAICGFGAGMAFLQLTGLSAGAFGPGWLGTNFIFCGIALGGIFLVPNRGSLALVVLGSVLCCLAAIGIRMFLRNFNIPPLSLPFNVVVMLVLYALRRRETFGTLFESPYTEVTPEVNLRHFNTARRRFPDALLTALFLPFRGERVVTQGFHGKLTHKGWLCHALDFEALDEAGQPLPPQKGRLEETYTFGTPILSPCAAPWSAPWATSSTIRSASRICRRTGATSLSSSANWARM